VASSEPTKITKPAVIVNTGLPVTFRFPHVSTTASQNPHKHWRFGLRGYLALAFMAALRARNQWPDFAIEANTQESKPSLRPLKIVGAPTFQSAAIHRRFGAGRLGGRRYQVRWT
jgi:hypothetical protein